MVMWALIPVLAIITPNPCMVEMELFWRGELRETDAASAQRYLLKRIFVVWGAHIISSWTEYNKQLSGMIIMVFY